MERTEQNQRHTAYRCIFMTKEMHLHLGAQFDDAPCEQEKMNRHTRHMIPLLSVRKKREPQLEI